MVSVPFPREHDFYVVSVPFSREQVYYGKCIFPVFQAVNDNVCSISCLHVIHVGSAPYTKEHGLNGKICLWEVRDLPKDDASPVLQRITRCWGSLASAHKLPISGRQDSGWLGARVTDQALWNLDLIASILTRSSMTAVNHALPATTFGIYFGSDGAEVVDSVAAFGIAVADVIYVAAVDYVAGALATDLQIYGQPYSDVVRSVMEDRENSSRFVLHPFHLRISMSMPTPLPSPTKGYWRMFFRSDADFQDTQIVGPRSDFHSTQDTQIVGPRSGFRSAPTLNGLRCWISNLSECFWIAVDHTVFGDIGIASDADAISGATSAVTDDAGNAFNGDLGAFYDSQLTAMLSPILDISVRSARGVRVQWVSLLYVVNGRRLDMKSDCPIKSVSFFAIYKTGLC